MADAPLKPIFAKFVASYLANGRNATQAAKDAGYAERSAHKRGSLLLQRADVKQAIATASKEIIDKGKFDLEQAIAEIDRRIDAADRANQHSAVAKLVDTKVRIAGLMVDRVDLRAAVGFVLNVSGIDFAKRDGASPEPEEDFSKLIDKD